MLQRTDEALLILKLVLEQRPDRRWGPRRRKIVAVKVVHLLDPEVDLLLVDLGTAQGLAVEVVSPPTKQTI